MTLPSSLVRGTKSSTADPERPSHFSAFSGVAVRNWLYEHEIDNANAELREIARSETPIKPPEAYLPDDVEWIDPHESLMVDESKAGQYLRLECEEWRSIEKTPDGLPYTPLDSENSVRKGVLIIQTKNDNRPPPQSGERWTERLSDSAKHKIEQSALYMHKMGKGYRTFITLTLTPEWRAQLEKWDKDAPDIPDRKSIGQLISKWLNTLQQRHRNGLTVKGHYRRDGKQRKGGSYFASGEFFKGHIETPGKTAKWTPIKWREPFKIRGHKAPFQYIWVAECPKNDKDENNPHVHVLINWNVKKDQFHAWAKWIETTWGMGFAKIEKIKKPAAAAYYMAKAARYVTKGNTSDQGRIRGNRYNIARDARPPKNRLVGIYHADKMHKLLNTYLGLDRRHWPEGVWFHRYGFGASSRQTWGRFLQNMIGEGFQFKPPPISLIAAMFRNGCVRVLRQVRDHIETEQAEFLELAEAGRISVTYT